MWNYSIQVFSGSVAKGLIIQSLTIINIPKDVFYIVELFYFPCGYDTGKGLIIQSLSIINIPKDDFYIVELFYFPCGYDTGKGLIQSV